MNITILTLFPEMFQGPFQHSIIKHAQEKKLVTIDFVNIREFGIGKHRIVDDRPFGGGTGMILRVDVLDKAIEHIKNVSSQKRLIVLLDPRGIPFSQKKAQELSKIEHLVLICGHYEGFDERVLKLVDESISIGDYILTGGEIPAMVITDAIARLIPGVLKEGVTKSESFSGDSEGKGKLVLEHPQYTRPRVHKNMEVPKVLLLGNHAKSTQWRKEQSKGITKRQRPDLTSRKHVI